MNLNICTISSRNDFIEGVYNSLPWERDIVWHIARAASNPIISDMILNDNRVRVHHLTSEDTDTSFKMNYIFQYIINTDADSYFCILDDDTVFHKRMHGLYKKYSKKKDKFMVIGQQCDKNKVIRLPATLPYECAIDSGNVLCHSHVLTIEKWPDKHWNDTFHADFDFWDRCYKHFGLKYTDLIQEVISHYNLFSKKSDTLDYVR